MNHHDGTQPSNRLQVVDDFQCLTHRATLQGVDRCTTRRQFACRTEHDGVSDGKYVDELTIKRGGLRNATADDHRLTFVNRRRRRLVVRARRVGRGIPEHVHHRRFAVGEALADVVQLHVRRCHAHQRERRQHHANGNHAGASSPRRPIDENATSPLLTTIAPPFSESSVTHRQLHVAIGQFRQRQRKQHEQYELVRRQPLPRESSIHLEHRPVIQIQPVRPLSDVRHHSITKQCVGHRGRRVHGRSNHGHAGNTDQQEPATKQHVVPRGTHVGDLHDVTKHRCANRQCTESEQEHAIEQLSTSTDRRGLQQPRAPKHRKRSTKEQAPCTGERAEEQEVDARHGLPEERHELFGRVGDGADRTASIGDRREYCDRQGRGNEEHSDDWQPATTQLHQHQHEDRPDHVELLLHRQRPEMSERDEVECREIGRADPYLEPVEPVHQRRNDVAAQISERVALEDRAVHRHQEQQHPQCRQQTSGAS